MPRGRTPREAAKLRRAVSGAHTGTSSQMFESLETRRYFITLQGGDTYDYVDSKNNTIRIQLTGTIVAEFLAARVYDTDNHVVVVDPVPPWPSGQNAPPAPPNYGADLFNIYVADASDDAQIIISKVNIPQTGPVTFDPYGGSVGTMQIINAQTGVSTNIAPTGGGTVYVGARTKDLPGAGTLEANIPITFINRRNEYGVRPGTRGIYAGIETAEGVSLDKVFIGGTLTGRAYFGLNVNTFHVNDLLTGNAEGLLSTDTTTLGNNFFVAGSLRNMLVTGDVGVGGGGVETGKPVYRTGFDARVGGKLGNVTIGGDFSGNVEIVNNPDLPDPFIQPIAELEYKLIGNETIGSAYMNGLLANDLFVNDTENDTAQFGASHASTLTGLNQSLDFSGQINTEADDFVDNYSVPMIAGQKMILQLNGGGFLNLGVYDPLGRLVASDFADPAGGGVNDAFQFTAELPGTYRLAVATYGDGDFDGDGGTYPAYPAGLVDYTLGITEYGEVALGGMDVDGSIYLTDQGGGITVRTGDLGAVRATDAILAELFATLNPKRGNLREVDADTIGLNSVLNPLAPDLVVPRGSVGYVHADTLININPSAVSEDDPVIESAVGFDYQRVETEGELIGNLVARRAIGSIIAGSIPAAPIFYANADNRGQDGRIDLIQVSGDFGSLLTGGPGLFTGQGGNVKYAKVTGDVYTDSYFGSGANTELTLAPGKRFQFTDDSGATGIVTPTTVVTTTPSTGGGTGTPTTTSELGQLTVVPYGVRESGGVVMMRLESTTSVTISTTNRVGSFDITELTTEGVGTAVQYDDVRDVVEFTPVTPTTPPTTGTPTTPTGPNRTPSIVNAIRMDGRAPINVLQITGTDITNITNSTTGEIVAVDAASLGMLTAQSIGYIKSSTASAVVPETNLPTGTYPFNSNSFGFNITGSAIDIQSREAIGTVSIGEAVGRVTANYDGKSSPGIFEGIVGPVVGHILKTVDIGEGVAYAGSGEVNRGGVFATGGEESVIQQIIGRDADIRGTIGSEGSIEDIFLSNGSIINATIGTPETLDQLVPFNYLFTVVDTEEVVVPTTGGGGTPTTPTTPTPFKVAYGIGTLRVTGNGGIIGSYVITSDFNNISVGGFGILGSIIQSFAKFNANNSITADGLGIRGTFIEASTSLNSLKAKGTGSVLNVNNFSASVLQSASRRKFDAYSGRRLAGGNDLHKYLGTSRGTPAISGVTNSGIIENVTATGALDLGSVDAFMIRDGVNNTTPVTSTRYPMRLSFANSTGKIKTLSSINGLQLRTGRLESINAGGDLFETSVRVSGKIKSVTVGRALRASSSIEARGPEGAIGSLFVRRGMLGTLYTSRGIDKMDVGDLAGTSSILGKLVELTVQDDVLSGTYLRATQGIGKLFVGDDVEAGATISARSFGEITILGTNSGNVVTS